MILFGKSDATKRLKLTNQLKSGLIVYVTSLSLLKATTAAKLNVVSSVYFAQRPQNCRTWKSKVFEI